MELYLNSSYIPSRRGHKQLYFYSVYTLESSGDRIPVGSRFSAPVQTGSEAYPASYTMDTESFPGCGVGHTPHLAPRLKRVELYLYVLSGLSWPVLG
jgi:hypothetical protein